jgi:chromosome segregation ATPase
VPPRDAKLDALYELPLGGFTAARNALAKELGDPEIRKLAKPSVPAWAVNQLVRREAKLVEELLEHGQALQKQTLKGSVEALRDSQRRERETVRELVRRAEKLLDRPSAQTLERVAATLTAGAQSDEGRKKLRAGRLTEELEPTGFEALAGMAPAKRSGPRDELADARRAKEQRGRQRRKLEEELRKLERRASSAEQAAERLEEQAAQARKEAEQARREADEASAAVAEL